MGGPQLIRETLELLTRPLRHWRWTRYRNWVILRHAKMARNPLDDDGIGFYREPEVPLRWEERDHADIKQDAHRWVEKKLRRWSRAHSKAEAFLGRVKRGLKKKKFVGVDSTWDPMAPEDGFCCFPSIDEDPAFWNVPKEIRDEKRRDALKQALRRKVPKAWEDV